MPNDRSLREIVADTADAALTNASSVVSIAKDGAGKFAETASSLGDQAQSGVRGVRENPLGLVLAGLAAGMLAGAIAPVTEFETRKIAPLRDNVVERARRTAGEIVAHGRGIIEETLSAASASATKHGQTLAQELQDDWSTGANGAAPEGSAA